MAQAEDMDYRHPHCNTQVTAIGGHYVFTHEHRLTIDGRTALVFEGYGVAETSCCGTGGCRYAVVPGDLRAYRYACTPGGHWVSRVSPVRRESRRRVIRDWLIRRRQVQHVVFL
jgi:hypothetical protein